MEEMNNVTTTENNEVATKSSSNLGVGVVLGAVALAGVELAVKFGKKQWAKHKDKKATKKAKTKVEDSVDEDIEDAEFTEVEE